MRVSSRRALSTTAGITTIVIIIVVAGVASTLILTQGPSAVTSSSSFRSSSSAIQTSSAPSSSSVIQTSSPSSTSAGLQKVTFMLDFLPVPIHSAFFYGIDQGIYAKHGIDLTIQGGSGSASDIAVVSQGKADFADVDPGTLSVLAARGNATNVRAVGVWCQDQPYVIIYNNATVHKISDLNGKTLGTFQGSGTDYLFRVFAKLNNLNQSSIKVVIASPAGYLSLVALGKADFIITTANRLAALPPLAAQNKITLGSFNWANYGLNIYGFVIVANTQTISNRPDVVKNFIAATMESVVQAGHNPSAALASFLKHNPQQSSPTSYGELAEFVKQTNPNINSSAYLSNPLALALVNATKMQYTVNLLAQGYGIANPVPIDNLYTNQFVQQPK